MPIIPSGEIRSPILSGKGIAVTGGEGFIGSHLVERVAALGAERIAVIDREARGMAAVIDRGAHVELHRLSLGDAVGPSLEDALDGMNAVLHFAAAKHSDGASAEELLRTNVIGSEELYEAAISAGVERIVFASSLYVYGAGKGVPLRETDRPSPATVYGASKLAAEHLLAAASSRSGIEHAILRCFFVYGPGQRANEGRQSVIVKNFRRMLEGEPPIVRGDGQQALDYVYVDDVVEATMAALCSPASGLVVNIGSGSAPSVLELTDRMRRIAHFSGGPIYEPPDSTAGTTRLADISLARRLLGWQPRTSLDDGLARTLHWLKQ